MKKLRLVAIAGVSAGLMACTSVETTTVSGADIVANGGEAIAVAQAESVGFTAFLHSVDIVSSDLDQVVNKLLISEAKAMGGSKVDLKGAYTTPRHGIFTLPGLILGFPSSGAVGVVVK